MTQRDCTPKTVSCPVESLCKPEARNSKAEGNPKPEVRNPNELPQKNARNAEKLSRYRGVFSLICPPARILLLVRLVGFRPSFGLRLSGFGFLSHPPPTAALLLTCAASLQPGITAVTAG